MRDPFEELDDEHRVIEKVLGALESAAEREMPAAFYAKALEFIASFSDAVHHAKEEERLFTYLETRGMPRDYGPINVMLLEHDSGRRHAGAMRGYLADGAMDELRRESTAFTALMREHIEKEDDVLFPMGKAMLTPEEIAEIGESFLSIPVPAPGYEAWVRVAEELAAEAGVPV